MQFFFAIFIWESGDIIIKLYSIEHFFPFPRNAFSAFLRFKQNCVIQVTPNQTAITNNTTKQGPHAYPNHHAELHAEPS